MLRHIWVCVAFVSSANAFEPDEFRICILLY